MEREQWICPECSKAISADDTVNFVRERITHFYCRQPRTLSAEERTLLFLHCWEHAVAKCRPCAREYRLSELAQDLFSGQDYLCPQCRVDLLDSVRRHLYSCSMVPAEVMRRAQVARQTAQMLVKQGHELGDQADVLMQQAEEALDALRKTIRELARRRT
jgi:hypothetical protein